MTAPAGWHPDPHGEHRWRFWDGNSWSDRVSDAAMVPHENRAGGDVFMWCCLGLLFAPVGVAASIVLFARNRVGPGIAVLMCSALGAVIALAVFVSP